MGNMGIVNNIVAEKIIRYISPSSVYLDSNNILWRLVDDNMIGKRNVWTFDKRACWLEQTTKENIKSWWCGGENADYNEIFYK